MSVPLEIQSDFTLLLASRAFDINRERIEEKSRYVHVAWSLERHAERRASRAREVDRRDQRRRSASKIFRDRGRIVVGRRRNQIGAEIRSDKFPRRSAAEDVVDGSVDHSPRRGHPVEVETAKA